MREDGPTVIEAKTYRHSGHHVNDPGLYMDPEILAEWKAKDPVDRLRKALHDDDLVQQVEAEIESELEDAVEFAKQSPEAGCAGIFSKSSQFLMKELKIWLN